MYEKLPGLEPLSRQGNRRSGRRVVRRSGSSMVPTALKGPEREGKRQGFELKGRDRNGGVRYGHSGTEGAKSELPKLKELRRSHWRALEAKHPQSRALRRGESRLSSLQSKSSVSTLFLFLFLSYFSPLFF
ncbi:hypothetical protein CRG98_021663 [Punica granatum]|uniref:Uncharacterized protein n=1 Tax=Punica granatum TaxID=22663 RepID=A0A2I0JNS8_PUNGR|nr:hypothetical protein CRG98_021663 [Punica granatum]